MILAFASLISILIPVLSKASEAAAKTKCLSNIRNMEMAHLMYVNENKGRMIQAGLSHGRTHGNEGVAWINTLQTCYQTKLVSRCPSDDSPHWPGGYPVEPGTDHYRRANYGFLDGHAESLPFRTVLESREKNKLDPAVAQ